MLFVILKVNAEYPETQAVYRHPHLEGKAQEMTGRADVNYDCKHGVSAPRNVLISTCRLYSPVDWVGHVSEVLGQT